MTRSDMRKALASLFTCVTLSFAPPSLAAEFKLASLDWPPYTGERLQDQGAVSAIVVEAFKAADRTVAISFFPWGRAVDMAKNHSSYVAYFPEYHSTANEADFYYSDPIGIGPLVFIERTEYPVTWDNYDSLQGKKIGVVRGYVNTDELDRRIANDSLTADAAPDDTKNLLKLASGRIDLAVIDLNVFNYLAKNDADIEAIAGQLKVNSKQLEEKKLYVCFKKTAAGEQALNTFNEGLKRIDRDAIMKRLMN